MNDDLWERIWQDRTNARTLEIARRADTSVAIVKRVLYEAHRYDTEGEATDR